MCRPCCHCCLLWHFMGGIERVTGSREGRTHCGCLQRAECESQLGAGSQGSHVAWNAIAYRNQAVG